MIPDVSGYKYLLGAYIDAQHPHGDLDRISISGRCRLDANAPLYGEPVAWISECLLSREASLDNYNLVNKTGFTSFERKVDGVAMNAITRSFNAMNEYPFVSASKMKEAETFNRVSSYNRLDEAVPNAFMGWSYSETVPVVSSGDPVLRSPINSMASYMGTYFSRGVMNVNLGSRHGPTTGYSGTKLYEENRVEVGGWTDPHVVSEDDGLGYWWHVEGNGAYSSDSWGYYYHEWRTPSSGSVIRLTATEDKLRHIDLVRPVFLVHYHDYFKYSDRASPEVNNDFRSIVVSGSTYRFNASGAVAINAADAFYTYAPGVSPMIEGPSGSHENGTTWTHSFYEQIDSVWLIATMKPTVCATS